MNHQIANQLANQSTIHQRLQLCKFGIFLHVRTYATKGHPYHPSFCMPSVSQCHDVTMAHGMHLADTIKNNLSTCHVPPLLVPYEYTLLLS